MPGGTPAHDPLSQVVPGKADMGDDYDAIVVQMTQLVEHSDPAQQPPWDGSGLPETVAEMQELDMEDLKRNGCHGVRRLLIAGLRARRHGTCSPEP